MKFSYLFVIVTIFICTCCQDTPPPQAVLPVPTERQLAWHELERYAFVHFTTNTFTGKEWGFGDENPSVFNPSELDAEQWVKTIKEAGMKGLILTCKHHDGFCLWPSKYTEHSVKNSPFRGGRGDVVKEVSEACRKHGILFGIYLSPWDRNHPKYGTPEYVTYYRNQMRELIENYGPVFEVWMDGANGGDGYYGGAVEKRKIDNRTYYDWPVTWKMIRQLAPGACMFSDAGPDIRWCGNEDGYVGNPNWCTTYNDTLYPGCINSAKLFQLLEHGQENGTSWIPAEVDVSIRPGWFYHTEEDNRVRTPENLFKIYLESVGRGSCWNLNIPPDRRGLFHENDIQALRDWKKLYDKTFANNYALNAKVSADHYRGKSSKYAARNVVDGNKETYWATDDGITDASIEMDLGSNKTVNHILLQEYIRLGQRVSEFTIEVQKSDKWETVANGHTIGYKRIIKIAPVETRKIRINIIKSRACPLISNIEIY